MQELLNEAVIEMLNEGLISMKRVKDLIDIKEFIDRISTKKYINDKDVYTLVRRYGVMPTIVTWGDYFQSDLASALQVVSDEEFDRILDTIRFDVISSHIIFCEKENDFFQWVESMYTTITASKIEGYNEEEEEILHLKILMDYFVNMGIADNFSESEMKWYYNYSEAQAV